jgi:hypothetical protein
MRLRGSGRLVALTLVAAVALLALLVAGAAGGPGKGKPPQKPAAKNGRAGFHFLVLDQAGTADRLIIQGDGNFNGNRAHLHAQRQATDQEVLSRSTVTSVRPTSVRASRMVGVVVTFPGPPQVVFAPTNPTTGVTIFTLGEGHSG